MTITHQDILDFWFSERIRQKWWVKDEAIDAEIRERFLPVYRLAVNGELSRWRQAPVGRLAEIIVLDQFPRNMFRDRPEAFAHDDLARQRTREAVTAEADTELSPQERAFMYIPLMHSEAAEDHELAIELYSGDAELADSLDFERRHKAIIDRFGRYPHRNRILGRESTPEELEFLNQPGSSF